MGIDRANRDCGGRRVRPPQRRSELLLQIEAIKLHHFDPGGNEVAHELGARIAGCVDLGEGSQLRV